MFIQLDDDLLDKLRDEAWDRHMSRSALVRIILDAHHQETTPCQ